MKEFPNGVDEKTHGDAPAEVDGNEAFMLQGPLPEAREGVREERADIHRYLLFRVPRDS